MTGTSCTTEFRSLPAVREGSRSVDPKGRGGVCTAIRPLKPSAPASRASGAAAPHVEMVSAVDPVRLIPSGVSPLRAAGLLRFASSRCQTPSVSLPSGSHPSRGLAAALRARWRAGCRRTVAWSALSVRSRMQRSRLRRHRNAEQPGQAGVAGGGDESGPVPCPWIAGLVSFTLRVNEARLSNWSAFHSRRCASFAARRPDRHHGHPPSPMPGR